MKLSISNIAWDIDKDEEMYAFLNKQGYSGLEIAPTRIFADKPYEHITEAKQFAQGLYERHRLSVSSMQSIWFGRNENIFGIDNERNALIDYTKQAIDFAVAVNCKNLVFGCPKNRIMPDGTDASVALDFFETIADYAGKNGVVIAFEPNPAIYGTNFINYTEQAFEMARSINSKGFAVNIDVGTIIENSEDLQIIADNLSLVNHVHISEPGLDVIKQRGLHNELCDILTNGGYDRYVSIEMKNLGDIEIVKRAVEYVKSVFGDSYQEEFREV